MEKLNGLLEAHAYADAVSHCVSSGVSPDYVYERQFLDDITAESAGATLAHITNLHWIAATMLRLLSEEPRDLALTRTLVEAGLTASAAFLQANEDIGHALEQLDINDEEPLDGILAGNRTVYEVCYARRRLLEMQDRLCTYAEVASARGEPAPSAAAAAEGWGEIDEGDGWGELEGADENSGKAGPAAGELSPYDFITWDIEDILSYYAATANVAALERVWTRHGLRRDPHQLMAALECVPEWLDVASYERLLPEEPVECVPWREAPEWVEQLALFNDADDESSHPVQPEEVDAFYTRRLQCLVDLNLLSTATDFARICLHHGVKSVNGLAVEDLQKELRLLSLFYYSDAGAASAVTLNNWLSLSPEERIGLYLSKSVPDTIARDIDTYVTPYLEATGADKGLVYNYLLDRAAQGEVDLLYGLTRAHKPETDVLFPPVTLTKLTLACLYGFKYTSENEGLYMLSKVFENLPEIQVPDATSAAEKETAPIDSFFTLFDYKLFSSMNRSTLPHKLFAKLSEVSDLGSITFALETLDLHLAMAEIFGRYGVVVGLDWFILSHEDYETQRNIAEKMVGISGDDERPVEEFVISDADWTSLLDDMLELTESEVEDDIHKAFWLMDKDEVVSIYLKGLLTRGQKFTLAKRIFFDEPSSTADLLDKSAVERIIVKVSHTFYDQADSGNLNKGSMKLAFDCLNAAPESEELTREKYFIEATSRLCSFKLIPQPTPSEIRHSSDRLSFILNLLSNNPDTYKHSGLILDLIRKLGCEDKIRALSMMADTAIEKNDFKYAKELCQDMVAYCAKDKSAASITFATCLELGKAKGYRKADRQEALGHAMLLCPSDKIDSILEEWTELEDSLADGELEVEYPQIHTPSAFDLHGALSRNLSSLSHLTSSGTSSKTIVSRAASFIPSALGSVGHWGGSHSSPSPAPAGSPLVLEPQEAQGQKDIKELFGSHLSAPDISPSPSPVRPTSKLSNPQVEVPSRGLGFSNTFSKGVGWLIGADDEDTV